MRIVHHGDDGNQVLASDVTVAETFWQQLKGVMFKSSLPPEYGLVFPFDEPTKRGVHMLFVRIPIDVVWVDGEEVTAIKRLHPWTGYGRHRADLIIELPAGAANGVSTGDSVSIEE